MALQINAAVCSNKGCVRSNNEDNFCLNGKFMQQEECDRGGLFETQAQAQSLFAVCDGMGGEEAGEEASLLSAQLCARYLEQKPIPTAQDKLRDFMFRGCRDVFAQAEKNENHSGSTVALLIADDEGLHAANMGDSRIYRLTTRSFEQISEDHTEMQRLLRRGQIKPSDVRHHPKRHMILQYWGMPLSVAPFKPFMSHTIPCVHGEKYLLCIDGLTDMVENDRIEQINRQSKTVGEIAQELVDEALRNGGRDNVTAMVLEILEDDPVQAAKTSAKPKKGLWFALLGVLLAADIWVAYEFAQKLFSWFAG